MQSTDLKFGTLNLKLFAMRIAFNPYNLPVAIPLE